MVDKKALDLFSLHKIVVEEGGMDHVTRERRWTVIATRMGLKTIHNKGIGGILRTHYERIVHPYVTFQLDKEAIRKKGKNGGSTIVDGRSIKVEEEDIKDKDYVPHHIQSRMAVKPPPPSNYFKISRVMVSIP